MSMYPLIPGDFLAALCFTRLIFKPRRIRTRHHIECAERLAYKKPSNFNSPVPRHIFPVCGWLPSPILRRKQKHAGTTDKTNHNAQRRNAIPDRIY